MSCGKVRVHGCWAPQNCACMWWECQSVISKATVLLVGTCLVCGCRLCLGCPIPPISVRVQELEAGGACWSVLELCCGL